MSKTEGFLILDTHNAAAGGDNAVKAAGPIPQGGARRTLTDISNLPQKMRPLIQEDKSQSLPPAAKVYIEQLKKENMALVKMLEQRNKIIERSGIELERLRLNLIKAQEQNQQLALSHTQMLAEVNFSKDRLKALQHELGCKSGVLKALQHELGCKNGALKARKLEGGGPCNVPCQSEDEVDLIKFPEEGKALTVSGDGNMPHNTKRKLRSLSCGSSEPLHSEENTGNRRSPVRRQASRFKAVKYKSAEDPPEKNDAKFPECPLPDEEVLENESTSRNASENLIKFPEGVESSTVGGHDEKPIKRRVRSQGFTTSEPFQSEANAGNRRSAARRQSSRFKAASESSSAEDLSDKGDIKPKEPDSENGPTSGSTMVKDEDNKLNAADIKHESHESQRPSLGRPSRMAAQKVQTYKEVPLNVKMRRPE